MDFDEYDYLEKAVEDPESRSDNPSSGKREGGEKSYRSSRRREEDDDEDDDDDRIAERSKSKRSRGEGQNGERRENDERERSSRSERREKDGHRSGRDVVEKEHERDRERGGRERERERGDREREKEKDREREKEKDREREKEGEKERGREKDREKEKEREKGREKDREKEREREKVREKEREREREKEREKEKEKEKEKERERSRRSSSHSARHRSENERDADREIVRGKSRDREARERERERESEIRDRERDSRRFKEKKEVVEPEADPERDQRTVFAYQMPLKATERDVYEFFSKAGKVRDVRLIMDRNSRRSKGVGYIEFYDAMSVPMAIALSGHQLFGQPVMVKPSEAEKNLVQSTATAGGSSGLAGPYGAVARKLYIGNLHFNMTEDQLRQVFEPFGPVELVQLPLDLETGQCKGFGFVQFAQLEHAKAAQSLNGKLEIAGRVIKVSAVTDHVGVQNVGANAADFDDDDGGGLSLNAQSRAMLMQKLDRTGIATSIAGSLGVPLVNGPASNQQTVGLPINVQAGVAPALPALVATSPASEPVGNPSECLLLKNMFDPTTETEPDFDVDIKEEVYEECSGFGPVKHIYVDKHSAGYVYLRFETVAAAASAQRAMHMRWFARRLISAIFMQPHEYEAKFSGGH
ncbi:RNA recognition motif domain [Macleaya cordata]|uniref:RNA recognition motif domain n=1 Tax=Macleaya cordata TaxID=56857 RepID=A0A200PPZ3_MACCD|nr:RNA recognition motif domain [Macleaya cordata]